MVNNLFVKEFLLGMFGFVIFFLYCFFGVVLIIFLIKIFDKVLLIFY